MKILIPIILALAACGPSYENGPELTEKATVRQLCYCPSGHGSGIGVGVGGSGDVVAVPVFVDIPEKYAVVFECKHGKFIIEDEEKGSRAHDLWTRLKEGQEVTVRYNEVFQQRDGQRHLVKYHFIAADPVTK